MGVFVGFESPSAGFEAPFELLAACHERVVRMLDLMDRIRRHVAERGVDESVRQAAGDVMRYFDMAAPLHHQDEELHVFPPLLVSGDETTRALVRRLQDEHRRMDAAWPAARAVLQALAQAPDRSAAPLAATAADDLRAFADLYAQHVLDEDLIVYPAAQAQLSPVAVRAMSEDMMARRGVKVPP